MMASNTVSRSSTSSCYRSSKKPPVLPPTSIFSHQIDQLRPSNVKPPPIPIKPAKSANYYHVSQNLRSGSSHSASCSAAVDSKPAAVVAGGSDECYQDPDKTSVVTGDVFSLAEFVTIFKHSLPLRIRVKEGFCGKEERSVISAGDVYNFHFIKNETVLSIVDEGGKSFSIPLNSSVKFGICIVHVSRSSDKAASLGALTYKTIGDLASCCIPPFVVRALQSFSSSETASTVEAEEVLIIKEVIRTPYHKLYVKAFSLHTNKQKILYEDCGGCFLTDPSCVQLYATEIVEHLKDHLPLKATLFLDSVESDGPLPNLTSEVVTLKHTDVESFIIATTCWDENDAIPDIDTDRGDLVPVAIPTDLKISVTQLGDQSESESLYEDTRNLYETFDPSKIYAVTPSDSSGDYTALKYSVRSGHEYQGLDIIKPSKIYSEPEGICSSSNSTTRCQKSQQQNPLPKLSTSHISVQNEHDVEELKAQLKHAWSVIHDLTAKCDALQKEVTRLNQNTATGKIARRQVVVTKEQIDMERNVKELRTLSCTQIQGLLQTLNLTPHLKTFCDEGIDGQLLSECDEHILQHELGISRAIHRAK